ncbi:UDP-N-acetylglucosamine 2-epimerase [Haloechinothrix salitolerans]|uniref:UDP-N-acetylglucosamine 2-epimerase n=1 Tax=Haloechinothrix salitolerans TaxID=926830 RepID=A0ABW2BT62_9PSEU
MTGDLPATRIQLGPLPRDTTRGQQLGHLTREIATVLREHPPEMVIVHGDTTSALAGALAANAAVIPLVHVEAGLRSFDRAMPEEHNRVLIDHLADLCCAPTTTAADNLRAERIPTERIVITGNTIVEAARQALPAPRRQDEILEQLGVTTQRYILATVHRPENADNPAVMEQLLVQFTNLPVPVVLPLHPRTRKQIQDHGLY